LKLDFAQGEGLEEVRCGHDWRCSGCVLWFGWETGRVRMYCKWVGR
jgi:hypothetical protein